ncbi:histidine kinase [Clostridium weizhouense]|uniref:Histidine kinase n=1 Tax=Clostridium weizhouense TaxID=2859781 RepID=A0ABS7AJ39_9CLOT|nr:histidine kinase [Clostridium weizhouense]MBW6408657.1 histidine kinase [Clostridium weizhouense]
MLIRIESIIDIVLQSIMTIIIINSCVKEIHRKDKKELIIIIAIVSLLFILIKRYNHSNYIYMVYYYIIYIFGILILYRKDIIKAELSYLIIYILIRLSDLVAVNILTPCIDSLIFSEKYIMKINFSIIYIVHYIIIFYLLIKKEYLIKLHKFIIDDKLLIGVIVLISIISNYDIIFYYRNMEFSYPLVKNIIIINIFVFFILSTFYFSKMKKETEQINKLNEALDIKNGELRKIKHDYGAQISYLYGLYLMKRKEKLGQSLKSIIDSNNNIKSAVQVNYNIKNNVISNSIKPIMDRGIHIIIEDNADIDILKIPENKLYTVLDNIIECVDNANGFIIIKTYNTLDKLVINIENNIQGKRNFLFRNNKINKDLLMKSKELIEEYDGCLYISKTNLLTEFEIILPITNCV